MKSSDNRGLVLTLDLVAALLLFLVIILTVLWLWGLSRTNVTDYRETDARQERLLAVSSMLVGTGGQPPDWHLQGSIDRDNVDALGLASDPHILDRNKLEALEAADYQDLREILGLGDEEFNVSVIENWSGDARVLYSAGRTVESGEVRVFRRYALLNDTRVELRLEAYYDK